MGSGGGRVAHLGLVEELDRDADCGCHFGGWFVFGRWVWSGG